MFKRFYVSSALLSILALWVFALAGVACGLGIYYGHNQDSTVTIALHAVVGFLGIMILLCCWLAVAAKFGLLAILSAILLVGSAWIAAGILVLQEDLNLLDKYGRIAMSFDLAAGAFGSLYLLLSIRSSRFDKAVVVVKETETYKQTL
eukprot:TRINITY_DN3942_c0_g1_i1.p1 TRINITY_DN3942_c0_g1~~TRINITY_DN3942_c0_g1_i1.p1  ORF type:complete len:148 (+),score=36.56 TRINITY_DN3942_c0_g1_i1:111-554(+)